MNRWAFLIVLALVGVAAFAVYTFGWRERGNGEAEERARAQAYASALDETCGECVFKSLRPVASRLWRVEWEEMTGPNCVYIDLDEFSLRGGGDYYYPGVLPVDCPDE